MRRALDRRRVLQLPILVCQGAGRVREHGAEVLDCVVGFLCLGAGEIDDVKTRLRPVLGDEAKGLAGLFGLRQMRIDSVEDFVEVANKSLGFRRERVGLLGVVVDDDGGWSGEAGLGFRVFHKCRSGRLVKDGFVVLAVLRFLDGRGFQDAGRQHDSGKFVECILEILFAFGRIAIAVPFQPDILKQLPRASLEMILVGHDEVEVAIQLQCDLTFDLDEYVEQKWFGVVAEQVLENVVVELEISRFGGDVSVNFTPDDFQL